MASPAFHSTRDVIIRTEDFIGAVRFYETVMGFAVTLRHDRLVGFDAGSFQLFVESGAPAHGPVFEMTVADIASAKERLNDAGCAVIEEDPKVPRVYMRDPYGLVFNLDRG
jgi:predicted enzyme related to lactoylglutathione lyase